MKTVASLLLATSAAANEVNPIEKVVQMMADLQAKIIKEGEASQKVYEEFAEWCEDRSKELGFEIKTGTAEAGDLQATIDKETANIDAFETKIDELSGSIATDEADLKTVEVSSGNHFTDHSKLSEVREHREEPSADTGKAKEGHVSSEVRSKVKAFGKMAMEAMAGARDSSISSAERMNQMHKALQHAAHTMVDLAAAVDLQKHTELREKMESLQDMIAKRVPEKMLKEGVEQMKAQKAH